MLLTQRTLAQQSALTPTTLIHIVTTADTSQNSAGSSYKAQLGQIFHSGFCIADLYVTNVHGCSPLNIQPTSPDNVIIAKGGGNVGIGVTPSNSYRLHVSGRTNTELRFADSGSTPSLSVTTNNNNNLIFSQVYDSPDGISLALVIRGSNETAYPAYGKQGDVCLYASVDANGLNIINNNGVGKDDYIRFYAGTNAQFDSPQMHIQGSGTTKGFVGIGTETPTSRLDISGGTGYNQFRMRTSYSATTSGDTNGSIGDMAWNDNYLYIRTNMGWGRISLDYSF